MTPTLEMKLFNLNEQTLTFDSRPLPIKKWEVWFQSPFGLIESLEEAAQRCRDNDIDPQQVLVPLPVAIDEAGRYEIIMRGT